MFQILSQPLQILLKNITDTVKGEKMELNKIISWNQRREKKNGRQNKKQIMRKKYITYVCWVQASGKITGDDLRGCPTRKLPFYIAPCPTLYRHVEFTRVASLHMFYWITALSQYHRWPLSMAPRGHFGNNLIHQLNFFNGIIPRKRYIVSLFST